MPIDPELFDILVCPKCKGELQYEEARDELVCEVCRLAYSIDDGIPVMLLDEARQLD